MAAYINEHGMMGHLGGGVQQGHPASSEELAARREVAREIVKAKGGRTASYTGPDRPLTPEEMAALEARVAAANGATKTTAVEPAPSLEIAKQFWSAFSSNDPRIRLRFIKHDRLAPAREVDAASIEAAWPHVEQYQLAGYEAYYFINRVAPGDGRGWNGHATDDDVTSIQALAIDADDGIPDDWELHTPPDLIVNSSTVSGIRKGQMLWLVSDCPVDEFCDAQARLAVYYGSDGSITNPSRILRLPGTLHQKDPNNRQLVTFIGNATPAPRPLATLVEGLPPARPRKKHEPVTERREVSLEFLEEVLPHIDPSCGRDDDAYADSKRVRNDWLAILSGIKNTRFTGKDDAWNEDMAVRWSAGEFWPDGAPSNYLGEEAVLKDYRSHLNRATFGSLVWHARKGGWTGNPPWVPTAEVFRAPETSVADLIEISQRAEAERVKQEAQERLRSEINLLSFKRVLGMPDPTELVEGLLMDRDNVAFVGTPKVGKTFIALEIALSIAAGLPGMKVLGNREVLRSGTVIYLSGEGHGGMKRRLRAWFETRRKDYPDLTEDHLDGRFFYNARVPTTAEAADANIAMAKAYIDAVRALKGEPVLVVIDTMARSLNGLDENSAASAALYLNMTEALREGLNCTVLTIAHASNKKGSDKLDFRGSSAFSAGFDAVWIAEKKEDTGAVKLHARWLKDADEEICGPLYFKLKKVEFQGEKRGGAVLESVDKSLFEGRQRNEKGQVQGSAPTRGNESDDAIRALLVAGGHTSFDKGLTDKALAEQICGPAPEGSSDGYVAWKAGVNSCTDRFRHRHKEGQKNGLVGEGLTLENADKDKNEWRWFYTPVEIEEGGKDVA